MSLASLETPRSTQYEETESEPEDLAPEREDEMGVAGAADPPLDSSDDEPDDDSELTTFESALPAGMCMADAPLPAQLEFKNLAGKELQGKAIMYNWVGLGWWAGQIKRPSADKSKLRKVDGERLPANFIVQYMDGSEGEHALTLGKYGKRALCEGERWVLLERAVENILVEE